MNKDLTQGKPETVLWKFCLPLFGSKEYSGLKTAVYTTLIASGVLCIYLMSVGYLFCNKLLYLINTPDNIFANSKLYLDIYILGLPFVFYYNVATGIFSALGDSKTPFVFLACCLKQEWGMRKYCTADLIL